MKLHFDSNQLYQQEAIKAVTDLFEGQPLPANEFDLSLSYGSLSYSENGFANSLLLTKEQIQSNTQNIQIRNQIRNTSETFQGMHFSVEMETGTGKTYVYLRTIYELNKLYGFKKFVIVVPSIAIREGVLKNLQITNDHFQTLYDNVQVNFNVYDSKTLPSLRSFAAANTVQILIINIDAFAKDENIINKTTDRLTGRKPVEFIQSCNPIVIVDEPQNMETSNRKKAIANLNPLCTLRYSATHTNPYNLLYSLNPVDAYNLGLVKQIEVDSVVTENATNDAFIQVEKAVKGKTGLTAKLKIDYNSEKGVVKKLVTVKLDDDLYTLSNEREIYKDRFKVTNIDISSNTVAFANGLVISAGETNGAMNDEILKFMIQKTIEEHLKKERTYKGKGIKVLSLFFIDKVKNYREYDTNGKPTKGKFADWFEELYNIEISKPIYSGLVPYPVETIHNGYFSKDNKGNIKDTAGETVADDATYKLIMQDKEKLLDEQTPLRFIFSHSALREGWDNPNVFQICTLNESRSEIKKRQEIGRGLRLPVDQDGQRIFDKNISRLTVIANESYEDFAKQLQKEIEDECGVTFTGIKNKTGRKKVNLRKDFDIDPKFLQIWQKINSKRRYYVNYDTNDLILRCSTALKDRFKMPETKMPSIHAIKNKVVLNDMGVEKELIGESMKAVSFQHLDIPDPLSYIQSKTELTRSTIFAILNMSDRIQELMTNPQLFMDNAVKVIKDEMEKIMIDGIQYERIENAVYEMSLFDDSNLEVYYTAGKDFIVNDPYKTIYENLIPLDSGVENRFAKDCEKNINIEFYFKLPRGFKINTPIGTYNPDWAVVREDENKTFFIVETKGKDQELLASEQMKIKCGTAYFNGLEGISYLRASEVSDLVS